MLDKKSYDELKSDKKNSFHKSYPNFFKKFPNYYDYLKGALEVAYKKFDSKRWGDLLSNLPENTLKDLLDYIEDYYATGLSRELALTEWGMTKVINDEGEIELDGNDGDLAETIFNNKGNKKMFLVHYHPTSKSVFDELFREKLYSLAKYYSDKYNKEFPDNHYVDKERSDALNNLIKNGKNAVNNVDFEYTVVCADLPYRICVRSNYLMKVRPLLEGFPSTTLFDDTLDKFFNLLGYKPEESLNEARNLRNSNDKQLLDAVKKALDRDQKKIEFIYQPLNGSKLDEYSNRTNTTYKIIVGIYPEDISLPFRNIVVVQDMIKNRTIWKGSQKEFLKLLDENEEIEEDILFELLKR